MIENLSLEKIPHYYFSSDRQFEEGEKHITRIYDGSILLLIRRGILRFKEDGIPIELHPGEYYIQRPNLFQEGVEPSEKPNYFFIHFKGHYSKSGTLPLRGRFDIEKVQPLIDQIDKLGESSELLEKESLFLQILVCLKGSRNITSIPEQIREYILNNYSNKITIDDIAKQVLLSKNQTINVFRNKYGITPHQLLMKTRLKKASELIISTNKSYKEICFSVGFSDYSNFFKEFQKEFGQSPKVYRLKISKNQLSKDLYKIS